MLTKLNETEENEQVRQEKQRVQEEYNKFAILGANYLKSGWIIAMVLKPTQSNGWPTS